MWTVALVTILAVAAYLYLRNRSAAGRPPAAAVPTLPLRRVLPAETACAEARVLDGKRYPASAAPHFPLPGCSQGQCNCQLLPEPERRHGERRTGHDRRGDIRFSDKPERRSGNDRRLHGTDWSQSI